MSHEKASVSSFNVPQNISLNEINYIVECVLRELDWSFSKKQGGYVGKTPINISKNVAGENIDISISSNVITFTSETSTSNAMWGNAEKLNQDNVHVFSDKLYKHLVVTAVSPEEVVNKITIYHELFKLNVIEQNEFENEKKFLIMNLKPGNIGVDSIDFLSSISPLLSDGAINREELNAIKAAIL